VSTSAASSRGIGWLIVGASVLAAVIVGDLSSSHPKVAAAGVAAVTVVALAAGRAETLPLILAMTIFVEDVSAGGVAVGRLAGGLALTVLACYVLARRRVDLRPSWLLAAVGAYGLFVLASAYWAADVAFVYKSFSSYALDVSYMLAFAILVRTRAQLLAVLAVLAVGALIVGASAFLTYAGTGGSVRAHGLAADPNYFAAYQVFSLPAAVVLASFHPRPARRATYYAAAAAVTLSVVASLSRAGLLSLVAVVLGSLLVPWRLLFRAFGQKVVYAFCLLLAAALTGAAGSAAFVARIHSLTTSTETGGDLGSGRLDLWSAALHGWHEHPWLGLGAGNFQARSLDLLQSTPGVNTAASYVTAGRPVHNAYLEALTELGVVGCGLFAVLLLLAGHMLVRSFLRAHRAGDQVLQRIAMALILSFFGFAVSMIFASLEYGKPLWILIGLALALDALTRQAGERGSLSGKRASGWPPHGA
jgi:O-antigen ligase